jgi:hypothetical protein
MTTDHLKMEAEPNVETLCISNVPQTMSNVLHDVTINIRRKPLQGECLITEY